MAAKTSHPLFNADAGNHPLPHDRRVIAAVLRATGRCYQIHPYFVARYGTRGEVFARSDGGYLATLVEQSEAYLRDQVYWLAGVLSNRGMPRWLMESHLDLLHEELCAANPPHAPKYGKLRRASDALAEARRAWIPQETFEAIAADFDASAGGLLGNMGGTIVSSVCDETCGLPNAVSSLTRWLADPDRFPGQWCSAVEKTVAVARTVAGNTRGRTTAPGAATAAD